MDSETRMPVVSGNLLTPDQITAIAPDASSLKAGRDIGTPRKWEASGGDSEVLWGLAMGSGKSPYQTLVSLPDLASKCSCPSRKFPCKHALGLMFLAVSAPPSGTRPAWAAEWLESRAARAEKSKSTAEEKNSKPVDEKAAEKRRAQREGRVAEGVSLLRQTILDITGEGLAGGSARNPGFWADLAKRMIDCQAPGLAGAVLHIGDTVLRDPEVDTELPFELGRLHLVLHALENFDSHDPSTQADLRSLIGGRSGTGEETGESVEDDWFVAARKSEERDRLITSTSWMLGLQTGRWARLLRFAPSPLTIAEPWAIGTAVRASLKFQPGSYPLRATPGIEEPSRPSTIPESQEPDLDAMLDRFANAVSENPFLRSLPFLISLRPSVQGSVLIDANGQALPWLAKSDTALRVDCICGGRPTVMCGEWDGRRISLLAIRDADAWIPLTPRPL